MQQGSLLQNIALCFFSQGVGFWKAAEALGSDGAQHPLDWKRPFLMFLLLIIPFCHIMIQAVIHRLLESIRGLNKSRLDWGLCFKFMERHQHRPRQQLPLILQRSATNWDAPFQIFIWWRTWKSRDGALYVVSWSCRRAGDVTSRTAAKQNILQLYNPSEPRPRTRLLPLPRCFTQPDTHCPLYYYQHGNY